MSLILTKNTNWTPRRGPVVLAIMDGVGYGKYADGDAVADADMRHFRKLEASCPSTKLKAHGTAVGLPSDDDMGNSEVGHNAMGSGRIFAQSAKLVSLSIQNKTIFTGKTWKQLVSNVKKSKTSTLHFLGLLSDGNVHSHIDHLYAMINQAKAEGVHKLRVHVLLDGRDVCEQSALDYINPLEALLASLSGGEFDYRIASGGGRQYITMDRYGANWAMVERGWKTHVCGQGKEFASASEAILYYRAQNPALIDQDMHEFVITDNGKPVGTINDGDSVIYFNFRGDRALEISAAFDDEQFTHFNRQKRPNVEYAGMMEYDGDMHVPKNYLVSPPEIDRTMGEYMANTGIKVLAISETQKYGHVTYFFNGNRQGKFNEKLEDYVEIKSDLVPFEQRPWMKCAEITDYVIEAIKSKSYDFIRLNYPNGDMVGHTGVYQSVVCALESMDIQIGRLKAAIEDAGGILVITADHGNSDDMYEHDKKTGKLVCKTNGEPQSKTSHSLNPVPFVIYDPEYKADYEPSLAEGQGISSVAATCINLLGYNAPEDYEPSIITLTSAGNN